MINNRVIIFGVVLFTVVGLAIGVLGAVFFVNTHPEIICLKSCKQEITEDKYFFNDDIFVYAKDSNNNPIVVNLSLSRKKLGDFYLHYYYANVNVGGFNEQEYTSFNDASKHVKLNKFLSAYSNKPNEDLSTRESYTFAYKNGPIDISVDSEELNGDFITKNTLEYTRYVTEGKATLSIGGKSYPARIAVIKAYTANYDKYVYFDGWEELRSLAQQFIFWDDKQNFYLVDKSEVYEPNPNYKSHTWILYKDATTQSMKKAFSGEVKTSEENGVPSKWSISIPELNTTLSLNAVSIFGDKITGVLGGAAQYGDYTGSVGGYYSNTEYGK